MNTYELNISANLFRSIVNGAISATIHTYRQGMQVGDEIIYIEQITMYPQLGLHDVRQSFMPSSHWAKVKVASVLPAQEFYPDLEGYSLIEFSFMEEGIKIPR